MNRIILIMVLAIISAAMPSTMASGSKDKLIRVIEEEQNQTEQKLINMWMSKKRGKEFELLLSEYVTREVRHRAMTDQDDKTSLLAAVNAGRKEKISNPIELGRLLVLEYFKRKGVDLQDQRFVKGTYSIGLNEDYAGISEEIE